MRTGRLGWTAAAIAAALAAAGCGDDDGGTDAGDDSVDAETSDGFEDLPGDDGGTDVPEEDAADAAGDDGGTGVCEERFWIWDLSVMPPRDTQICASLRGAGEHTYVWVEDEEWGATVDAMSVEEVLRRWNENTPADSTAPDLGIFEILTGVFGDPPDVFDADPRIHVLLYGMEPFGSTEFDGYFRSTDQTSGATSNRREMIHINSRTARAVASPYMIAVMAHEFNHMQMWSYDTAETTWLSESFAELAMILTGYRTDLPAAVSWARAPSSRPVLVDGVGNPVDYGAVFLLGAYLYDRLAADGVAALFRDPGRGAASVEDALQSVEPGATFLEFLADFAAAVAVDDPAVGDGRYGFLDFDLPATGGTRLAFPASAVALAVPAGGVRIARLPLDDAAHAAIAVTVSAPAGSDASVAARVALVDDAAGTIVRPAPADVPIRFEDVPASASEIAIAWANVSGAEITVSVSASDE